MSSDQPCEEVREGRLARRATGVNFHLQGAGAAGGGESYVGLGEEGQFSECDGGLEGGIPSMWGAGTWTLVGGQG